MDKYHEPIISRKMFEAANKMLDSRSIPEGKSKHSNRYCFSGKSRCGKCGNVGCSNGSIRNEDALHVMYLVVQSLQTEREAITQNIIAAINSVVSFDTEEMDTEKLHEKIRTVEEKKARLLELYMSKDISREELLSQEQSVMMKSANVTD